MELMNKNKMIDHTLLRPDASAKEIEQLCIEAKAYGFASVCVNPCNIETARSFLAGSDVKVCTVVGFPLGAMSKEAKAFETEDAIKRGADEIDAVINIGRLKEGNDAYVKEELSLLRSAAQGRVLKVILEACLLSKEEIIRACLIAKEAGADFVKTSTGFSSGGARVEDVRLMRSVVKDELGVKASGGIRTKEVFEEMIEAGASRIGTSSGVKLLQE